MNAPRQVSDYELKWCALRHLPIDHAVKYIEFLDTADFNDYDAQEPTIPGYDAKLLFLLAAWNPDSKVKH